MADPSCSEKQRKKEKSFYSFKSICLVISVDLILSVGCNVSVGQNIAPKSRVELFFCLCFLQRSY